MSKAEDTKQQSGGGPRASFNTSASPMNAKANIAPVAAHQAPAGQQASSSSASVPPSQEALISFGNLEAVVRTIMEKFSTLQNEVAHLAAEQREQAKKTEFGQEERRTLEQRLLQMERKWQQELKNSEHRRMQMEGFGKELETTAGREQNLRKKVELLEQEKVLLQNLVETLHVQIREKVPWRPFWTISIWFRIFLIRTFISAAVEAPRYLSFYFLF